MSFVSKVWFCLVVYASLNDTSNCAEFATDSSRITVTDSSTDVSRLLAHLQAQIKSLQDARHRDQSIIRRLRTMGSHQHHGHHRTKLDNDSVNDDEDAAKILQLEKESLARLQSQVNDLKDHLAEMVGNKEKGSKAWLTIEELRNDQDALRNELNKLRKEFDKRTPTLSEEDSNALKHLKTTQVTTRWLRKTVEELKSEMNELAQSVNVSAAFRQSQMVQTNLTFVHSDLRSVRSEVEELRAGETKHSAQMEQLRLESKELGSIVRLLSKKHEDIANEVRSIQNDYSEQVQLQRHHLDSKLLMSELNNDEQDGSGDDAIEDVENDIHRARHRRRLKVEMSELRRGLISCQGRQKIMEKELKRTAHAFKTINHTVSAMRDDIIRVQNRSVDDWRTRNDLSDYVDDIRDRLTSAENKIETNSKFLANVNETASTIKMLHDSSVKLFRAVETVEEEYGKTIGDMRKEVSKCDFNLAQIQSSNKVLREDLTTQEEKQRILSRQLDVIRGEVERDHYRLLVVQNEALNRTLVDCKERNENALSALKLNSLEHSVTQIQSKFLDHQNKLKEVNAELEAKVAISEGVKFVSSQRQINETILILSRRILELQNDSQLLNKYLNMMARKLPKDCSMEGVAESPSKYNNGVYLIHPIPNGTPAFVEVACDMSSHDSSDSWTYIQRRFDGSEDFYRTWDEYRVGFGHASGEYWLGNDLLHTMTTTRNYTLRIEMWDTWGHHKYAEYAHFKVGSEEDNYRLSIGGYSGNASNAMEFHNQMGFSTRDRDNDASSTHCAVYYSSGWWYNHCQYVNINGKYNIGLTWYDIVSHEWVQLTKVEMKIRPGKKH